MKKIIEIRTKIDAFILKHLAIIGFITIVVMCPWIADMIEWLMEKLEDFFVGPLNMSHSTADDFAAMIIIYSLVVGSYKFITWATNFIMKAIRNHKKKTEVSE